MLYEAGYDKIELHSAAKGMNQNIAPNLLPMDYSYYIENIMPLSLGDGQVRYGNSLFSSAPADDIIDGFPFSAPDGSKQMVLYFNGYKNFNTSTILAIISSKKIIIQSPVYGLLEKDTYLKIQYKDTNGFSAFSFYEIKDIENVGEDTDTITITFDQNSFPSSLQNFYIQAPGAPNPQYVSGTEFSITIPDNFTVDLFYPVDGVLKLSIDAVVHTLIIDSLDISVPGQITFTTSGDVIPAFTDDNVRVLSYQSFTPEIISIAYSSGYIKVLDVATDTILTGDDQTIDGLSVACVPRAEFFAAKLWIYNGVDSIMTWDGSELSVYEEAIKEDTQSITREGDRSFNFVYSGDFFTPTNYAVGKSILLTVNKIPSQKIVIAGVNIAGKVVTITTGSDIPAVAAGDRTELFYYDRPPKFSYMKGAKNRLWCLGEGAVGLDYRVPEQAMRVHYSYDAFDSLNDFKFFNEKNKLVPRLDVATLQGEADNLEAIVEISGNIVFMGRKKSQVWQGDDPRDPITSPYFFKWSSTIPVGVYHGNLIVELANDAQFLTQNGFVSFGTLNIAKQFAASNTANMDKMATKFMTTIDSNIKYRSCRSFKYNNGGFCGFKIGGNDLIVSKFHTSFFWWGIFSGDFTSSSSFLSTLGDSLYLFIGKKIYRYADGLSGLPALYADSNGDRSIDFAETKYVNNIKKRYANKRYEIQADYSSSVVINPENNVSVYIAGDLRDEFILQDKYSFPSKGDVLGTINLVDGRHAGPDPNQPDENSIGMRLSSPTHTKKGRLKFLSNQFSVTIAGKLKNGPFNLKQIRLFGVVER